MSKRLSGLLIFEIDRGLDVDQETRGALRWYAFCLIEFGEDKLANDRRKASAGNL